MQIHTGYNPRPIQLRIHQSLKRFNVLVAHRRLGKTVLSINALLDSACRCQLPNPRYAYIAPLFNQAKNVAWDYLKNYTRPITGTHSNEAELRVDLPNGARLSLFGADNPDRLRGQYFDGVVLDEYADMSPRMWGEVIRPALADRKGWVIFIGTPKGRNQFWELYDKATRDADWYTAIFKASETGILPPEELAAARAQMSEDQYNQEFECSWQAALIGAYYGREMNTLEQRGHITMVPHDPALKVYTGWDLGIDDATAIWFAQVAGPEVRLIDYYENNGCDLLHYANVLKSKPYVYEEHFLPHDVQVRELGSGRSRRETLEGYGIPVHTIKQGRLEDGINAVRLMLQKCWFDIDKCRLGIESMRQYQRDWDDKLKTFRNKPRHDFASHGADAMRTLAVGLPVRKANVYNSYEPAFAGGSANGWMAR